MKPLDLQAILEAMEAFAPDRDDRPAGARSLKLSGASQAASEGVSSWALTRALWQFHLAAADDAALGGGDGGAYGRGVPFPVVSIPAAQAAIGAPGFGRDAQSLQRFGGLQEGLARLG